MSKITKIKINGVELPIAGSGQDNAARAEIVTMRGDIENIKQQADGNTAQFEVLQHNLDAMESAVVDLQTDVEGLKNGGTSGGVTDVQINGTTIVNENGIADIPTVEETKGGIGLVRLGNLSNGSMGVKNINGSMCLAYPEVGKAGLTARKNQGSYQSGVVTSSNFDLAVKVAMTDGIGTEWTETERTAARARMGAVSMAEVLAAIEAAMGGGSQGENFPTAVAGVYEHGSNFTKLLYPIGEVKELEDFGVGNYYYYAPEYGEIEMLIGGDVILPDEDMISALALSYCGNIVIPESAENLEFSCFSKGPTDAGVLGNATECKMETMYVKATTPPSLSHPLNATYFPHLKKVVVHKGCADVFKSATNWSEAADIIVEVDE